MKEKIPEYAQVDRERNLIKLIIPEIEKQNEKETDDG